MDIPHSSAASSSRDAAQAGSSSLLSHPTSSLSRPGSLRRKQRHPPGTTTVDSASHTPLTGPSSMASSSGGVGGAAVGGTRSMRSASIRTSTSHANRPRRPRDRHALALESIRHFLKARSTYDVLPVSFRLIVLDTQLVVGPALDVMWGASVVSAPLWHSIPAPKSTSEDQQDGEASATAAAEAPAISTSAPAATTTPAAMGNSGTSSSQTTSTSRVKPGFAGMLTVNDIIHLIQYYYHHSSYEKAKQEVESFRLEGLRDIEAKLAVPPPPLLSCHPLRPLFEACQLLMKTHARRLPLLDHDEQTGIETVVSVLTQYRVLKFIAMNCRETASLHRSLRALGLGTFVASVKTGMSPAGGSRRGSEKAEEASGSGSLKVATGVEPSTGTGTGAAAGQGAGPPVVAEGTPVASEVPEDETPTQEHGQDQAEGPLATAAAAAAAARQSTQQQAATTPTTSTFPTAGPSTIPRTSAPSDPSTNPHHPLYTATLDTTVFDVVHMFSERGISAVPILDEEGYAVDMYESVDVITLVRSGAYQALDLTIRQALERRPADFPGVYACSPEDSVANIFALLRKKRVHRLLIVEPEEKAEGGEGAEPQQPLPTSSLALEEELEKSGPRLRRRGRLVGILALSDLLRHIIGLDGKQQQQQQQHPSSATPSEAGGAGRRRKSSDSVAASAAGGAATTAPSPPPALAAMTTPAAPALSGLPQAGQSQGMAAAAESGSAVGDETIVETPTAETPNPAAATEGGGEEVAEVGEGKEEQKMEEEENEGK